MTLSKAQLSRLRNGHAIQLKHEDIVGSGINWEMTSPATQKKVAASYHKGKGIRVALSEEELAGSGFNIGKAFKSVGKSISKTANKTVNKASDWGKKNLKEKDIARVSLKTYNKLNDQLEKHTGNSLHGMVLNEVVGAVPFIPDSAKEVASHYANRAIDKQLEKETKRVGGKVAAGYPYQDYEGAGFANPFVSKSRGGKIANPFKKIRRAAKKLGIEKEVLKIGSQAKSIGRKAVKGGLKAGNKHFDLDLSDELIDSAANEINKKIGIDGKGFNGKGFSRMSGSGFNPVFATHDRTMLSLTHPALRPLPPPRPIGYKSIY